MKYVKFIAAALFFWALADHPYGYYTLLRWVGTIALGLSALAQLEEKESLDFWTVLFGLGAIIMNPLIPIHLDRDTWAVIDIVLGGVLVVSGLVHKHKIIG